MSRLYVIASPIGNLGDLSLRAKEALSECHHVLAEDTRRSHKLLSHLGITGKSLSCLNAHAREGELERAVRRLEDGEVVALLTDAGTPAVSDPGSALVRRCHERGIPVTPIPGPSAVTTAVAASGLVEGPFLFAGFLPRTGSKRQRWLERIRTTEEPVVLFEAANRAAHTLTELCHGQPERLVCVARELTKKFESVRTRSLAEWCAEEHAWRGELTLVLGPLTRAPVPPAMDDVDAELERALARGTPARQIAAEQAHRLGLPKREVYQRVLMLKARGASEPA